MNTACGVSEDNFKDGAGEIVQYMNKNEATKSNERLEILKEARAYNNNKWPSHLWTGVLFFKGERITREEFEANN